ncbi:MAG TPA: hypothetical protein VGN20_15310, partial [Mucilaginibacter sp.]
QSSINLPELKIKRAFPYKKQLIFQKKSYLYIRKRRQNVWKTTAFFLKLTYTNMGKSKRFCPTAKPHSHQTLKKILRLTAMSWPREGLVTFVLAKVTKTVPAEMLLYRQRPLPTIRKNSECRNLFAGLPCRTKTSHAKISYALGHFTGRLFFRILAETVLLTRKNDIINST